MNDGSSFLKTMLAAFAGAVTGVLVVKAVEKVVAVFSKPKTE